MNVQVTKHSPSPAEKSSCSPGALVSPRLSPGCQSGWSFKDGEQPGSFSETRVGCRWQMPIESSAWLEGALLLVSQVPGVSALGYLFGRSQILRLISSLYRAMASDA